MNLKDVINAIALLTPQQITDMRQVQKILSALVQRMQVIAADLKEKSPTASAGADDILPLVIDELNQQYTQYTKDGIFSVMTKIEFLLLKLSSNSDGRVYCVMTLLIALLDIYLTTFIRQEFDSLSSHENQKDQAVKKYMQEITSAVAKIEQEESARIEQEESARIEQEKAARIKQEEAARIKRNKMFYGACIGAAVFVAGFMVASVLSAGVIPAIAGFVGLAALSAPAIVGVCVGAATAIGALVGTAIGAFVGCMKGVFRKRASSQKVVVGKDQAAVKVGGMSTRGIMRSGLGQAPVLDDHDPLILVPSFDNGSDQPSVMKSRGEAIPAWARHDHSAVADNVSNGSPRP